MKLGTRTSAMFLCGVLVGACDERPSGTGGGYVGAGTSAKPESVPSPLAQPTKEEKDQTSSEETNKGPTPGAEEAPPEYAELTTTWGLGELHDLGPAGPATATEKGAYLVTRSDQLVLVPRQGKDGFVPLEAEREFFAKYGRGPSISKTHAYWVSERKLLLRAPLKGGEVEVLFDKARLGTRTSVVTAAGRDVVTFIAEVDEQPYAYVWASKGTAKAETLRLTPQGATATSVQILEGDPHPRAVVLAGRLGMSPVHVRRIRTTAKRLTLEPDEVVWIGAGAHVLTEIHGMTLKGDNAVAFLPMPKDFDDFGLAQLSIGHEPGEIETPGWHIYPNGLDPAPVATGHFCGDNYVLFARPSEARPRAPQELHLVPIKGSTPGEGEVVARSKAFNDLSLAPTSTGAVAVWTADRRTWGMVLTCPKK